jgi:hypothetical protein
LRARRHSCPMQRSRRRSTDSSASARSMPATSSTPTIPIR